MNQVTLLFLLWLMMAQGISSADGATVTITTTTNATVTATATSTQSTEAESLLPIVILYVLIAAVLIPLFLLALRDTAQKNSGHKEGMFV